MIIATATASASSAFHHTAACSQAAAPVPAITGATAFGSVRGRAPSIHCAKVATSQIVACLTMFFSPSYARGCEEQKFVGSDRRKRLLHVLRRGRAQCRGRDALW